jgi:hypothetical protein
MMEMLSDERYVSIVCWLPHGKGFVILDKKRFQNEVMPKYFRRKGKFTSFTRKLNRWYVTVDVYLAAGGVVYELVPIALS